MSAVFEPLGYVLNNQTFQFAVLQTVCVLSAWVISTRDSEARLA